MVRTSEGVLLAGVCYGAVLETRVPFSEQAHRQRSHLAAYRQISTRTVVYGTHGSPVFVRDKLYCYRD